jgi:hypothetical protein
MGLSLTLGTRRPDVIWLSNFGFSFLATLHVSAGSNADTVPHLMRGSYVYYSTDMSPVEVWLGQVWYRTEDEFGIGMIDSDTTVFIPQNPVVRAKLPRAYINMAEPYSQTATHSAARLDVLPDRILTPAITLTMTYPEGLPYSVVYETWPEHKPDFSNPALGTGVAQWQGIEEQTRAILTKATPPSQELEPPAIPGRFNVREHEYVFKTDGFTQEAGGYEGFSLHLGLPTNWQYCLDDGPDEIRRISCTASVAKSRPNFFCQYDVPINSRLYAELTFLDFRFHGGSEFARERIRAFKKFACPIFQCDERALKAADIKGSKG